MAIKKLYKNTSVLGVNTRDNPTSIPFTACQGLKNQTPNDPNPIPRAGISKWVTPNACYFDPVSWAPTDHAYLERAFEDLFDGAALSQFWLQGNTLTDFTFDAVNDQLVSKGLAPSGRYPAADMWGEIDFSAKIYVVAGATEFGFQLKSNNSPVDGEIHVSWKNDQIRSQILPGASGYPIRDFSVGSVTLPATVYIRAKTEHDPNATWGTTITTYYKLNEGDPWIQIDTNSYLTDIVFGSSLTMRTEMHSYHDEDCAYQRVRFLANNIVQTALQSWTPTVNVGRGTIIEVIPWKAANKDFAIFINEDTVLGKNETFIYAMDSSGLHQLIARGRFGDGFTPYIFTEQMSYVRVGNYLYMSNGDDRVFIIEEASEVFSIRYADIAEPTPASPFTLVSAGPGGAISAARYISYALTLVRRTDTDGITGVNPKLNVFNGAGSFHPGVLESNNNPDKRKILNTTAGWPANDRNYINLSAADTIDTQATHYRIYRTIEYDTQAEAEGGDHSWLVDIPAYGTNKPANMAQAYLDGMDTVTFRGSLNFLNTVGYDNMPAGRSMAYHNGKIWVGGLTGWRNVNTSLQEMKGRWFYSQPILDVEYPNKWYSMFASAYGFKDTSQRDNEDGQIVAVTRNDVLFINDSSVWFLADGDPVDFEPELLDGRRGTLFRRSLVYVDDEVYYLSNHGPAKIQGRTLEMVEDFAMAEVWPKNFDYSIGYFHVLADKTNVRGYFYNESWILADNTTIIAHHMPDNKKGLGGWELLPAKDGIKAGIGCVIGETTFLGLEYALDKPNVWNIMDPTVNMDDGEEFYLYEHSKAMYMSDRDREIFGEAMQLIKFIEFTDTAILHMELRSDYRRYRMTFAYDQYPQGGILQAGEAHNLFRLNINQPIPEGFIGQLFEVIWFKKHRTPYDIISKGFTLETIVRKGKQIEFQSQDQGDGLITADPAVLLYCRFDRDTDNLADYSQYNRSIAFDQYVPDESDEVLAVRTHYSETDDPLYIPGGGNFVSSANYEGATAEVSAYNIAAWQGMDGLVAGAIEKRIWEIVLVTGTLASAGIIAGFHHVIMWGGSASGPSNVGNHFIIEVTTNGFLKVYVYINGLISSVFTSITPIGGESPSPAPSVLYVKNDATGANDGSSWTNAYTSLRTAINNSSPGDEIWVAKGTGNYTEATYPYYTLNAHKLSIYGGFAGTETALSQRDPIVNETIIDGGGKRAFEISNHTYIVDGFIIQNVNDQGVNAGCGFRISGGADITIRSCTVRNSNGTFHGAGIYATGTNNILIDKVKIHGLFVAALYNPTYGCAIAIISSGGSITLSNSLIYENIIQDWQPKKGNGGVFIQTPVGTTAYVVNNTITDNDGVDPIYNASGLELRIGTFELYNNIIYGNDPGDIATPEVIISIGGICNYGYNDIGSIGISSSGTLNDLGGNISVDPDFVDESGDNYTLNISSPCIDSGVRNANIPTDDILGIPRPQDFPGIPDADDGTDMGCYELPVGPLEDDTAYTIQIVLDPTGDSMKLYMGKRTGEMQEIALTKTAYTPTKAGIAFTKLLAEANLGLTHLRTIKGDRTEIQADQFHEIMKRKEF